jgi:hypothetical protein
MAQGTTKGVPIDVDPLLNLDSDLVVPSQKAIKAYVDAKQSQADSDYVNVSGDTMTGYLLLHADPSTNLHAVTKQYVDNYINGLDYKTAAHVGTVAALPAYSISVNKLVLTGTANGAIPNATFDNHAPLVGERVLVKNETSTLTPNNGIYVLTQVGDVNTPFILTRSADADSSAELGEATLSIINGDTLSNTIWHCTPASVPITIGTTNLTFIQVGSGSVGTGVVNELTYWASTSSLGSLATATYPNLTELSYVKGVTSSIQTQFSNKEDTITTLAVSKGGTGFASYTIGDLLYADGTTSLAKLAGVDVGSVLVSGGVGAAPSWSNGPTLRSILLNNATNANTLTLQSGTTSASYTITMPPAASVGAQYLQSTGSGGTLQWTSGTTTGVSGIGTINSATKSANGAVVTGSNLIMQTADASFPGLVSTGSQIWEGTKTFNASPLFPSAGILLKGTGAGNLTISYNAPSNASLIIFGGTIATQGGNNTFSGVNTYTSNNTFNSTSLRINGGGAGNLTVSYTGTVNGTVLLNPGTVAIQNGNNTFSGTNSFTAASNQLILSSGVSQLTINSGTSAAARTYTVPDVGTTASFVMTAGSQDIAGTKTFTGNTGPIRFSTVGTSDFSGPATGATPSAGTRIVIAPGDATNVALSLGWATSYEFWFAGRQTISFYPRNRTSSVGYFEYITTTGGTVGLVLPTAYSATAPALRSSGMIWVAAAQDSNGGAAPSTSSRSVGTKVILRDLLSASTGFLDAALGSVEEGGGGGSFASLWLTAPRDITFYTNNSATERFRINSAGLSYNGTKILGSRITGWTTATGTANRATFATFATQAISNPPTQAQVQAISDHVVILSQRMKALIDDLHATAGHGLIGT